MRAFFGGVLQNLEGLVQARLSVENRLARTGDGYTDGFRSCQWLLDESGENT
jgi:hypothetical protein